MLPQQRRNEAVSRRAASLGNILFFAAIAIRPAHHTLAAIMLLTDAISFGNSFTEP